MEKDDDYNFLVILHLKSEQYMQTVPQTVGDEKCGTQNKSQCSTGRFGKFLLSCIYIFIYFIAKRCQ